MATRPRQKDRRAGMTRTELLDRFTDIPAADWDAIACPEAAVGGIPPIDPFTTHRFLSALDASGSTGTGTCWSPRPLILRDDSRLLAATPLYLKSHSQGEYIFDHGWAQAYERAGGRYYPTLQIAVPFTPATGRRFLAAPDAPHARDELVEAAIHLARSNRLSSLHITFCTGEEAETFAPRHGQRGCAL